TGDPSNSNSGNRLGNRQISFGARVRLTETGTATQSAFAFGITRHSEAKVTTAGALAGTSGHFGFTKALGSNAVTAYARNTSSNIETGTVGTIVAGTSSVTGTWVELACVVELRATTTLVMDCYVNGQYVLQHSTLTTATTPTADAYAPFFDIVNGVGADC